MQRLKTAILVLTLSFVGIGGLSMAAPGVLPSGTVFASSSKDDACAGLNELNGGTTNCSSSGAPSGAVNSLISEIVQILAIIVGAAAIIMILFSGFKYITSNGDANRVGSAKTTLLYALIGLVVAALAQILVTFVLTTSNNVGSGKCPTDGSLPATSKLCH